METLYSVLGSVSQRALVALIRYGARGVPTPHPDEVVQVPSRDAGRTIKVHVYRAADAARPTPVLINFHGSGFVIPLHGSDDAFARHVRDRTPYAVLDVQYRLAPEHPFPAACDDAEDVARWVLGRPAEFDAARVAVAGFSAGANLALGLAGGAGAGALPPGTFGHVAAFYPPCDLAADPAAKAPPVAGGRPIPAFAARLFDACYAPPPRDRRDPRISPLFLAADRFPDRVLVVTCAHDTLAPEAEALADKIRAVPGKHVRLRRIEGANHAWDKQCKPGTPQEASRDEAYDMVVKMLCE